MSERFKLVTFCFKISDNIRQGFARFFITYSVVQQQNDMVFIAARFDGVAKKLVGGEIAFRVAECGIPVIIAVAGAFYAFSQLRAHE